MRSPNAATPAPELAGNGRRKCVQLGSERILDSAPSEKIQESQERDRLLIALDFIGEAGDRLTIAAMAVCAAAAAENVAALELALRMARATLADAIAEFRRIAPRDDRFAAAVRDYHKNRGGRR
ncbi:MAG: hypothetical protein AB7U61_14170 [Methylocystis sp.]